MSSSSCKKSWLHRWVSRSHRLFFTRSGFPSCALCNVLFRDCGGTGYCMVLGMASESCVLFCLYIISGLEFGRVTGQDRGLGRRGYWKMAALSMSEHVFCFYNFTIINDTVLQNLHSRLLCAICSWPRCSSVRSHHRSRKVRCVRWCFFPSLTVLPLHETKTQLSFASISVHDVVVLLRCG
jgi:hypothetical protein